MSTPIHTPGDKVRLIGLKSRPEYNGVLGTVVGPLEGGRYPVRLEENGGLKVKPSNLRKGTPAAAGGPVRLPISDEERKLIPLPRNVKKLLAFVESDVSDGAKLETCKSLQGHAESTSASHQEQLLSLGVHTTCVRVLDAVGPSDVVKGAAGGVLQNLAMNNPSIDALLDAGCVAAFARRLAADVHPLGREGAADGLLNLSSTARGKACIGACSAAVAALVGLAAEPPPTRASSQATAMAVLGCLLQEPANWVRVVHAGALRAAAKVMRRRDTTAAGYERAIGLCMILAMALPDEHRGALRESSVVGALHEAASSGNGQSEKARKAARECMALLAQRGELSSGDADGMGDVQRHADDEKPPPVRAWVRAPVVEAASEDVDLS